MDELKLKITLDSGEVVDGFVSVEKQAKKSSDNIESSFDRGFGSLTGKIKSLGVALAAAFTVNKLVGFFKDSANEAIEAEKATNAFAASLAQIGKFSTTAVDDFSAYAQTLQATTGIQDDFIKQNAALLVSLGNLSGQGLKDATKAALDLSQALQIDAGTAFDLVAKASTGNTAALSRYGIKIAETIPVNERFAATLDLIQRRFGGLAETRLNTLEGSLINLSNAFGEVRESIGSIFTDSASFRAAINFIADSFFKLAGSIAETVKGRDVLKGILTILIDIAGVLNNFVIAPFEVFFNLIKTGVLAIKLAFDGLVIVIVGIAKTIVDFLIAPIEGFIGLLANVANAVGSSFGPQLLGAIDSLKTNFSDPLAAEFEKVKGIGAETFDSLSVSAETAFNTNISGSVNDFLIGLREAVVLADGENKKLKDSTVQNAQEIAVVYSDLVKQIKASFVNGLSRTFQEVGANLVKGKNLFSDFGASLLGIFADIIIQIGTALLLQGLAIEAFIAAITTLLPGSGFAAAAAGIGLIIFGGALKAAVGKGGASTDTSGASAGGGIAASPNPATEITPTESVRQEPTTQISVVVEGSILDSDESGSRIIDLINKNFERKGTTIASGAIA